MHNYFPGSLLSQSEGLDSTSYNNDVTGDGLLKVVIYRCRVGYFCSRVTSVFD